MIEMEETATILNHVRSINVDSTFTTHSHLSGMKATDRSLVLMDEVGRGTSIREGFAIARAVLESICHRRTRTMFATHFHELGMLDRHLPGLCAHRMHVLESATHGLVFAHRVVPGIAEHSHGLHIAQLAGCPREVIARATELLNDQAELENSINIDRVVST